MRVDTKCVSAERKELEDVLPQSKGLNSHVCSGYFDYFPLPLIVVNSKRQIVFSNKAFMDTLGVETLSGYLGKRPGEAMGCIYSSAEESRCGPAAQCNECGALMAVLEAIKEKRPSEYDCQLLIQDDGGVSARDFQVNAAPWDVQGEAYYVVTIIDISDRKRREVLEHVFFHDILNSVGGAQGLTRLLMDDASGELKDMLVLLSSSLFGLSEEIRKQKDMVALEKSEYTSFPVTLQTIEIMQSIADEYVAHPLALEKVIDFDVTSPNVAVSADYPLLRRVIVNMLVNALEASSAGGKVRMGIENRGGVGRLWVHNDSTMPESVQLQIFKRSFSTKGEGRGVGTYSIKLLTENYLGGKAGFSSTEEGTIFWVDLPVKDGCL